MSMRQGSPDRRRGQALCRRALLGLAPLLLLGCERAGTSAELTVFAAASLTDALREASRGFTGARLTFNFASSGQLARQLLAKPAADVFVSANQDWMDRLEAAGRLVPNSRVTLLSNRLVVIASLQSKLTLTRPSELSQLPFKHIVIGSPGAVPAGSYAKQWLESIRNGKRSEWEEVAARQLPMPDVRAVVAQVRSQPDAVGIAYRSDVTSASGVRVIYEVPAAAGPEILYPLARIAGSGNPELAERYAGFLRSAKCQDVFRRHGFVPVGGS